MYVLHVYNVDADSVHHQVEMMCTGCLSTVLMLTLGVTSLDGRWMFMLWVDLLFLFFSGNFSLMPTATARSFGQAHYPRNYGLVFTSQAKSLAESVINFITWRDTGAVIAGIHKVLKVNKQDMVTRSISFAAHFEGLILLLLLLFYCD